MNADLRPSGTPLINGESFAVCELSCKVIANNARAGSSARCQIPPVPCGAGNVPIQSAVLDVVLGAPDQVQQLGDAYDLVQVQVRLAEVRYPADPVNR
jgi:hypothetical protein